MAIIGEHICRFQYVNFEKEATPYTITNYLCKKLEDTESKHVAYLRDCIKIFLSIPI